MKAKYIFEKFEEESDPIKDLGIGLNTFENLKPGDIIQRIAHPDKRFTFSDKTPLPKDGIYIIAGKRTIYSEFKPKEMLLIEMIAMGFRYSLKTSIYYDIIKTKNAIISGKNPHEWIFANKAPLSEWKKQFKVLQREDLIPPKNI
jgi:hypothetical protein